MLFELSNVQTFIQELIYHLEKESSNLYAIWYNMNITAERLKRNLKIKLGACKEQPENKLIRKRKT